MANPVDIIFMLKKNFAVLFVCTGNICRSPTAEGVFAVHIKKAGLEGSIRVDSAGTHGYHIGDPPDPRTINHASRRGYDLSGLQARRLAPEDYDEFDLILAMDRGHHGIMLADAPPASKAEIAMFLDFAKGRAGHDVPDPYYGGEKDFEHVLDLIEAAMDNLLTHIRERL